MAKKAPLRRRPAMATYQYQADSGNAAVAVAMDDDRARRLVQFVTLLAAAAVTPREAFREAFEK